MTGIVGEECGWGVRRTDLRGVTARVVVMISDGGVSSAAALRAFGPRCAGVVWSGRARIDGTMDSVRAVERRREAFGASLAAHRCAEMARAGSTCACEDDGKSEASRRCSAMLLGAAGLARERGIAAVIWPIHGGGADEDGAADLEWVADAFDRAMLVSRLANLEAVGAGGERLERARVRVEAPWAHLNDAQMVMLARDLGVKVAEAAWCEAGRSRACGECGWCRRWRAAGLDRGMETGIWGERGRVEVRGVARGWALMRRSEEHTRDQRGG